MLDLSRKLTDDLVVAEQTFPLNLSFDNVLKLFEMWRDDEIPVFIKPHFALRLLTGKTFEDWSVEQAMGVFEQIFEEHIQLRSSNDESVEYDLAGNVLARVPTGETEKPVYNIAYDGDFIFASFMQAYGLDLFKEQGRLHWKKFNALLAGLPDGTKFVEVIKIRKYKPQKGDSQSYIDEMRKLQREYALPGDDIDEEEEDYY